jgi:hypothetical protein
VLEGQYENTSFLSDFLYAHSTITNLDFMDGSWKNSQDSAGPRLIKLPTSVGDREKSYIINVTLS